MNNGVKAALARGAEDLVIVGDSRLPTPQSLEARQKGSLVILLNTHKQLTAKLRSVKYLHVAKEYNAAADSLATEALESKISRVVLAEARKSELATLNRIHEVIYEPREDEGTTKVGPRNLEHCERDMTGSDDCQLEAAGKCIQDDISGDCGDCGNIAEIPRSQASTRKTDNAVDEPSPDCPGASLGPVDAVGAPPRPRFHTGRRVWPYMERGKPDLARRQHHPWLGPFRMMRQAESILDDRTPVSTSTKRCRREFMVKWVGCDEPTWDSPSNLLCCGLLYDYLCAKKSERRLQMVQVADED
ncbi:hypothetical protein F442_23047 [Phytophthora nicotianae P10297]|uniref:Chromo domain-containing protein n=1 Tax=Phytophthora nicotianae P10297 TaxID=1317064 RepID=W2XY90_PHYNI|nr:hypothetical protein F442_23047 [Phytophthora nicotianae P10297]